MGGDVTARRNVRGRTTLRRAVSLLCAALAAEASCAQAIAEPPFSGIALIIGNDHPEAPYAHRDAAAFERFVLDVRGFNPDRVVRLRDVAADEVAKALQTIRDREEAGVLVYLSGRSRNPADGQDPVDLLLADIAGVGDRTVHAFLETSTTGTADEQWPDPRIPEGAGSNVTALVAASRNEIALTDETARHGLFTLHLLDALHGWGDDNGDGQVTAAEAKAYLDDTMTAYAHRELGTNQNAVLIGAGDAVLSTEHAVASVAAPSDPAAPREEPMAASDVPSATAFSIEARLLLNRDERRLIQRGLAAAQLAVGPLDGIFGRRTRAAIAQWQASRGVPPSGYLNADEAATLLAAGEAAAPPEPSAPGEPPPPGS